MKLRIWLLCRFGLTMCKAEEGCRPEPHSHDFNRFGNWLMR